LIDDKGGQLGVVSNQEAQRLAIEASLDLVEIAPNADPPVCRLMDYRKYLFEQNKQRQAAKKKQKKVVIKEMSFRPNTDKGDYLIKLNKIIAFLEDGDKVKISLKYRGREMSHQELGMQLVENLKVDLENHAVIEQMPKLEGRQIFMLISPKKK
jgi:translation initiation factor IF-3